MVLTIPIFGTAFFVYGVKSWGGWAAGALMVLWIALAAATSMTGWPAPIPSPPQKPLQRIAKTTLLLIALGIMGYGLWLDHTGAPTASDWQGAGMLALFLVHLMMGVIDRIFWPVRKR